MHKNFGSEKRLGLEAETAARGVDEIAPPHCQPLAPRGRTQHPTHVVYEEDDLYLDGAGAIGAIMGATSNDVNQYLMNFMAIYKSQEIPGMAFLELFYPKSKELQMKDEISSHKQLPGEAMHDT
ncbi:hypothetical protein KY290_036613 [Solanum tuberosum]|uniref:Uncharacterized protein n=1 Tax=Solanum tuberosum TaxID=4113 RepID=A0ABQ7TTY9_SOLTU|nr:hypothetical protein KY289_036098 [Solanum tuberosum]KAH0639352.1 hypothetical protein KY285_035938 [Solanum tuberosum]KAH0737908.1 hypothetical protein KY290_036613 [Solanum tuberosum]